MSIISETIKDNTRTTIYEISNDFEYGYTETRKDKDSSWNEKRLFMRLLKPIWISKNPQNILKDCGIETTEKRAQDFVNLFEGNLNGYYYASMCKIDSTDEILKLILGYISETFKKRDLDILKINNYLPSQYMNELLKRLGDGSINKKFQKELIDKIIDDKDKKTPVEYFDDIVNDDKFKTEDTSTILPIIEKVLEDNQSVVEEVKLNPKKIGFLAGQVKKSISGNVDMNFVMSTLKEKIGIE